MHRKPGSKKKILHILYSGLGGHGNVFFSLVDADVNKDFEYEALFYGIEDVRKEYLEKAQIRGFKWHAIKKTGMGFDAYRKFISVIRHSDAEIVFLHLGSYIILVKLATLFTRKKIIVRETHANHLKTKKQWFGLTLSLLTAYRIVFLSVEYRDEIKKKFGVLFNVKKTVIIPNGIDLNIYKPLKKEITPTFRVGMQSRLLPIKDHLTLIKAFAKLISGYSLLKPVKLFIAGDGVYKESLQAFVRELGITSSVVFTGMLEESSLPTFINSLDVYVHATLGETMSTAIMQVMACGLPIIASDVNGVNNMIIHNESGLLVPPGAEVAMANAIYLLLENKDLANRLAKNAHQAAIKKFSNITMFENYKKIFVPLKVNI